MVLSYNPFLVYCRELAPSTVSLTGDRAQGDDSKHDSHYIYVMHFPINLCGVEDSVDTYQTCLISYCAVMVFESYGILFFSFCQLYFDPSHDFHAQLCFHSHFIFTKHPSLGCRNV